ncbi:MAG: hypothetical protein FWC91_12650 [Defluviitaleaceae bacterium]|nr:hypothetical protein [Defluviitaleaceae bacterium]
MRKEKYILRYWLAESIFLSFIPFLIIVIWNLLTTSQLHLARAIGNGELILSSFLIMTPSLISNYRSRGIELLKEKRERLFLILLGIIILLLVTYIMVKIHDGYNITFVYITSGFGVASSIVLSLGNEQYLQDLERIRIDDEVQNEHN